MSIFKDSAMIGFLVKEILEKYPNNQVGKTVVQKMAYFLTKTGVVDFDYSMYHYGPYSSEVSGELNFAEESGLLEINWKPNKGYFIEPKSDLNKFKNLLNEREMDAIRKTVEKYGEFNAVQLSFISTALFLEERFNIESSRLVDVVHRLKPKYNLDCIEDTLRTSGVLDDSNSR
ncbi:MAG: hypothetical protein SVM80_12265 [Halobacteriota archaeon]|nr:hypothetical protein [Halobacteriota archaeon]